MAASKYSTEIKTKARFAKLSVEEMAFASLMFLGWGKMDAMIVAGLYNPAYTVKVNEYNVNAIIEKKAFADYTNTLAKVDAKRRERAIDFEQDGGDGAKIDFRSKDDIIDQLGEVSNTLRGKDRADVLMRIADLQQMKKDEVKEEDERIHFFLPLTCDKCPYKQQQREE